MKKVNVFEDGQVVARVEYNDNLDYWDGRNYTSGSTGRHKGLAQLQDGRFVLIHGTQWQGERDWAEIITREEATMEILKSENDHLISHFGLEDDYNEMLIPEKKK